MEQVLVSMTGFCFTWLNLPRIGPRLGSRLSLAETTLSFTGAASMCLLSHLEHTKSIRPSALLNFYLFFSVLFDAIQLQTLWEIQGLETVAQVFSSAFVLKVALLVFEPQRKAECLINLTAVRHQRRKVASTIGVFSGGSTHFWLLASSVSLVLKQ